MKMSKPKRRFERGSAATVATPARGRGIWQATLVVIHLYYCSPPPLFFRFPLFSDDGMVDPTY